jgi:hypothetical protein
LPIQFGRESFRATKQITDGEIIQQNDSPLPSMLRIPRCDYVGAVTVLNYETGYTMLAAQIAGTSAGFLTFGYCTFH